MACFYPLFAYKALVPNAETGKRAIVFNPSKALIEGSSFKLPCGQCQGCRLDKAQDWATRCGHEAQMHASNCFVTLTFDDQNVPQDYSVRKRDFQLFMMKIRKLRSGVRFFGCGEYGDEGLRPHYHALLFNFDFADKKFWSKRDDYRVYKSELLEDLWPFGLSEIGSVTPQSGGYVARYCLKKYTGDKADDHYSRVSPIDGVVHRVQPEFALMSRRPGVGSSWFDKFSTDAFPSDFVVVDGRKVRPPAYYLSRLAEASQKPIKRARKRASVKPAARANSTPARLAVREVVLCRKVQRLERQV